jgi:ketosteroid isomerase-like protein
MPFSIAVHWRRPIMLASLTAALFLLAISNAHHDTTQSSQDLADIQQRLAEAWVASDRAGIERIIAPDWTVTGTDGRVSTRGDVLRDVFETKIHRISTVEIDDVGVRVFGDAAVVTGRTHGRGEYANVPYDVTIRFTDVFVRRDSRWQAVASHASLLRAARQ